MMAELAGPPPYARGRAIAVARPSIDPMLQHKRRLRRALKTYRDSAKIADDDFHALRLAVREAHDAGLSYQQIGLAIGANRKTVGLYANASRKGRTVRRRGPDPTAAPARLAAAARREAREQGEHQ